MDILHRRLNFGGDMDSGLVHRWSFDSNYNATIGGINLTNSGCSIALGLISNCLSIPWTAGSNAVYSTTPVDSPFSTGTYTLALWFYFDSSGGDTYPTLFSNGGGYARGGLFVGADRNSASVFLNYGTTTGNGAQYFGPTVTKDTWQHILFASKDHYVDVYKNGILSVKSYYMNPYISTVAGGGVTIGNSVFRVSTAFKGKIDDVRVYSRAFTKKDVIALFGYRG